MKSSINSDYNNDRHNWNEIERQLRNIAKAGFSNVQWIHDWEGEYLYAEAEMIQARELLDALGLGCLATHGTEGGRRSAERDRGVPFANRYRFHNIRKDYTSDNEYLRRAGVDLLKNRIDLTRALGAAVMVLHMQLPYKMFEEDEAAKERYYRQVTRSFDEVRGYAKINNVRIALENLICTPPSVQEEQFDRMFERYDEDFLGFCFDSGHASLMCRDDYYRFLRKYNDRLIVTHLQDNKGIPEELAEDDGEILKHDSHGTPYSGILDWDLIAREIARSPCPLPCDFEVGICGEDERDEFAKLQRCRQVADRFDDLVRSYREALRA